MQRIAILTSGGDAPGMNAAVSMLIKQALSMKWEPYVVKDGYYGLVNGQIEKVNREFAENIFSYGGTSIGTARLPEFAELSVRQIAVTQLKKLNITALIVIGGDGSYMGAMRLSEMGIKCIGIPGTIDNDINCTDLTIGFDTALNTIVHAIDQIRDTSKSHNRCHIVEVMGRHCGDLALTSGIATRAEIISSSEHKLTENEIINRVKSLKTKNYRSVIIVVSEHLYDVHELAKEVEKESGYVTRATILGHIQRGGSPTANDRILACRMAVKAIDELANNNSGICICLQNNKIVAVNIEEALAVGKRTLHTTLSNFLN